MPARFVNLDHDTPRLLPPDLRDWVPEDPLVHFIMEAVGLRDLGTARVRVLRVGEVTLALEGTKILASASKPSAVSHGHALKQRVLLEEQIAELLARADAADSAPLEDGLRVRAGRRRPRMPMHSTAFFVHGIFTSLVIPSFRKKETEKGTKKGGRRAWGAHAARLSMRPVDSERWDDFRSAATGEDACLP